MTERRDLKRRVRARQVRTGESYMTALRHVQGERPGAIPTVELVDLTELGAPLGFKCRVVIFPKIVAEIDAAAMLEQLRDALLATEGDRAFSLMRAVVLRGEQVRIPMTPAAIDDALRFVRRVKAGIGGASDGGHMLALQAPGRAGAAPQMLLFTLQLTPYLTYVSRTPTLVISSLDGLGVHPLFSWLGEEP